MVLVKHPRHPTDYMCKSTHFLCKVTHRLRHMLSHPLERSILLCKIQRSLAAVIKSVTLDFLSPRKVKRGAFSYD